MRKVQSPKKILLSIWLKFHVQMQQLEIQMTLYVYKTHTMNAYNAEIRNIHVDIEKKILCFRSIGVKIAILHHVF